MAQARRQFRWLTSLTLGMWLFALFVGIANACLPGQSLDGHPAGQDPSTMPAHHVADAASADCVKVCGDGVPLFAALPRVKDRPAAAALHVSRPHSPEPAVVGVSLAPARVAHPPADVPVYLRSLRLAL